MFQPPVRRQLLALRVPSCFIQAKIARLVGLSPLEFGDWQYIVIV
jgi:hypothetical protein